MNRIINKFFSDTKYATAWGVCAFIILALVASIYLSTAAYQFLERDNLAYNVITVEGEAEIFAVPDIATFNFTVTETSEDASSAQEVSSEKVSGALEFLKDEGVDSKDIKTTSYNSYPKYEWIQTECITAPCDPGSRELVGYEVRQTISVKVREAETAGALIAGITDLGINTISGVSFTIDDTETLEEQARNAAIADAKAKAKKLAKALDVKLDDVVSFSEGYDNPYYYGDYGMAESRSMSLDAVGGAEPKVAELPTGETTIKSHVYVTFEIE
jgi:uncharacterized protein YggE